MLEKFQKISKKDLESFSYKFNEDNQYEIGDNIKKFVSKNGNNLCYYLVKVEKNIYIRYFKNYEETNFKDFIKDIDNYESSIN